MRMFLICTHSGSFYPVEEVATEGDWRQSVDAHVYQFDEHHRAHVRPLCPEVETLDETEISLLKGLAKMGPRDAAVRSVNPKSIGYAREILRIAGVDASAS